MWNRQRVFVPLILTALLCGLSSPPLASDDLVSIDARLRQFADQMFEKLRATPETCEGESARCATFRGSFSFFKFEWESEIRIHYKDVVLKRGSWVLRADSYQKEYDLEDHTLTVKFHEPSGRIELAVRETEEPEDEELAEAPPSPDRRVALSGAELACDDMGESAEDLTGATYPVVIPESRIDPEYPDVARQAKLEGEVVLRARINRDGQVVESSVVEARPADRGFEEAAIAAVSQWLYEPAMLEEKPVEVCFTVRVGFAMH
jgi:TonB family protein